jgi:predicted peptidase
MRRPRILARFLARIGATTGSLLSVVAIAAAACVAGDLAGAQERSFTKDVVVHVDLNYLQWLPEGYEMSDAKWPLLLFLHGAGETGNNLKKLLAHGPPKLIEAGRKFPFIVVAPQSPQLLWNPYAVNALTEELVKTLKVDPKRVWLTGNSMGGNGTWMAASIRPELYAAVVPICGWGDFFLVRRLTPIPVWAFHGALDPIVPVAKTQELIDSLKTTGAKPKLTIYPDASHDSWTKAYEEPELWDWLVKQKKEE